MSRDFIVTKEHRRFIEFANAVRKERTIGICHGDAGVGKTQSGRRYAHWDTLEPSGLRSDPLQYPGIHPAIDRRRVSLRCTHCRSSLRTARLSILEQMFYSVCSSARSSEASASA